MPSPNSDSTSTSSRWPEFLTICTFIVLLAGDFGLERIGLPYPFPVPERLLAALLILILSIPPKRLSGISSSTLFVAGLLGTLAISIAWAPHSPGGMTAALDAITALLLALAFFYQCRENPSAVIRALALAIFSAGTIYAIAGLLSAAGSARISAFGGGPNVFARVTSAAVLAGLYLYSQGRNRAFLLAIPLLLVATFLSGSRGAMIALAVALTASSAWVLATLARRFGYVLLVCLLSAAGASVFFGPQLQNMFNNRILKLTVEERYSSGREGLVPSAVELFRSEPLFGWGIHAWEGTAGRTFGFAYPHNLTAQLAAELGALGLVILLLGIAFYLSEYVAVRRHNRDVAFFSISGATFVLVASQVSGDYFDARMLWIYMAVPGAILASTWKQGSPSPSATSERDRSIVSPAD